MQVIRRQAFRAINSSLSAPRSISTRTPFVLQSKSQPIFNDLFRRFASNDANTQATQAPESDGESSKSTPSSADQDDSSSISSAINSATESASTYISDAAEHATDTYKSAKESVVDAAQAAGAAAGMSAPRSEHSDRRPQRDEYNERRPQRDEYNDRRPQRDDRGFGRDRPELKLTPTNSIYVGNLLFDCTEEDLEKVFAEYGEITSVKLATDHRGLSKGFGYVEFTSIDQANAAIEAKHQTVLEGRRLVVNYQNTTRRTREPTEPSKTLFVGNLAFEMSDADLNTVFKPIRNVVEVRVAIDRRTGQPRGFAHAEFTDVESATAAIEALQGKEAYGRPFRIDYSGGGMKREGGEGGRGGYGGGDRRGGYGGGRGGDRGDRGDRGGDRGDRGGDRGGYGGGFGGGRGGGRGGEGGRSGGYGGDRGGDRY